MQSFRLTNQELLRKNSGNPDAMACEAACKVITVPSTIVGGGPMDFPPHPSLAPFTSGVLEG